MWKEDDDGTVGETHKKNLGGHREQTLGKHKKTLEIQSPSEYGKSIEQRPYLHRGLSWTEPQLFGSSKKLNTAMEVKSLVIARSMTHQDFTE